MPLEVRRGRGETVLLRWHHRVLRGLGAALCLALAGCGAGHGPSVLLITVDTLRADRLGCYGYADGRTPHLDGLAAAGVLFEQVGAQVPVTLPSHTTILTGLTPAAHGVHDNSTFSLADTMTTIAEVFEKAGYRTGAVLGAYVLARQFGLDQGFAAYDDAFGAQDGSRSGRALQERRAAAVVDRAVEWLEVRPKAPFFLWLHLFDPHRPYDPPPPFAEQFAGRPYDGEVAYVDSHIGRLLTYMRDRGLDRSTLVVVTSDHGEGLGEHGEDTHGYFVYEATMRVPLLVRWTGRLPAGLRVGSLTRTTDIAPTMLELIGLPVPDWMEGASVAGLIEQDVGAESVSVGEAMMPLYDFGFSPLMCVRTKRWKYIASPAAELYDLAEDPGETRNIVGDRREVADRMRRAAEAYAERTSASLRGSALVSEEQRAKLQALGYVSSPPGPAPAPTKWRELANPRDRLETISTAVEALGLIAGGRYTDALRLLRGVPGLVESAPLLVYLHAWALRDAGRYDEAAAVLHRAGALDSAYLRLPLLLGDVELARGNPARALAAADHAVGLAPFNPSALHTKGRALAMLGRGHEARDCFRAAVELLPSFWEARAHLATILLEAGEPDSALRVIQAAPTHPEHPADLSLLAGRCYEVLGRWQEAADAYRRVVQEDSLSALAHKRMAWCYHRAGMEAEATEALEGYLRRHGEDGWALSVVAGSRLARGDTVGAVAAWRRATVLDRTLAAPWAGLIVVAAARGQGEEASQLGERAISACPGDSMLAALVRRVTNGPEGRQGR